MSLESMIGGLSREEKLAALELIWQDLSASPEPFVSPKWHSAVLEDRLKNPAAGRPLPLQEAQAEVLHTRSQRALDAVRRR